MTTKNLILFSTFFAGAATGSLATFFMDPVRGNYRRAIVRDKGLRLRVKIGRDSQKVGRNIKNKITGYKFKTKKIIVRDDVIEDEVLNARVRSKIGRIVAHPKSVYVYAHDGAVVLSGPILKSEVKDLIKCVKKVAGVKKVINDLTAYATNKGISALQN